MYNVIILPAVAKTLNFFAHSGVRQFCAHRNLQDANVLKGSVMFGLLEVVRACFPIFLSLGAPGASLKLQLSHALLLQSLVSLLQHLNTFLSCCWLASAATETWSECSQESGEGLGSDWNRIPKTACLQASRRWRNLEFAFVLSCISFCLSFACRLTDSIVISLGRLS